MSANLAGLIENILNSEITFDANGPKQFRLETELFAKNNTAVQ